MDFGKVTLIDMMQNKLGYDAQRHDQLASNIAASDVPGYQARDLKPWQYDGAESFSHHLAMRVTDGKHFTGPGSPHGAPGAEKMRKTYETVPQKNNVVLEEQQKNMAMNTMDYNTILNLYSKYQQMFKTSVGSH